MREKSKLNVRFDLLLENFDRLKKYSGQAKTIFMIKAQAYGHGLLQTALFASEQCGVDCLGVATLGEAKLIREQLPTLKKDIFVFSDTQIWDEDSLTDYLDLSVIPVISDLSDLKTLLSDTRFRHAPLVLKFNTGMNRLGIGYEQMDELIDTLSRANVKTIRHVMTHFACSYLLHRPNDRTERQLDLFKRIIKEIESAGFAIEETSSSNSGAIEQGVGVEHTHIRPGLMLYGPNSCAQSDWDGVCISSLESFVLKSEFAKRGMPIGYGATPLPADGQLVYLPLGYGDGMFTFFAGKKIKLEGVEASFVGRVNMDISVLFIPDTSRLLFPRGRSLQLWGHDNKGLGDFAAAVKTHPYQILTGIGPRVPRAYPLA